MGGGHLSKGAFCAAFILACFIIGAALWRGPFSHHSAPIQPQGAPIPTQGGGGLIGAESRQPAESFPKISHYAASLVLACGDHLGSASLVYRNDIIVFSAHQIAALGGDALKTPPACAVLTADDRIIPILPESLITGAFAPHDRAVFSAPQTAQDWAAARLSQPLTKITPYRLGDLAHSLPLRGVNVSARPDNYQGPAPQHGDHPAQRFAQNCRWLEDLPDGRAAGPNLARLDCDAGAGSSGSGFVSTAPDPQLIAIITDSRRPPKGADCPMPGNVQCFTAGPLITPEIRAAIQSLAK